jgi:hypothetical protein
VIPLKEKLNTGYRKRGRTLGIRKEVMGKLQQHGKEKSNAENFEVDYNFNPSSLGKQSRC